MYNVMCTMVHQLILNMETLYKYMYHCTPTSYKYESTVQYYKYHGTSTPKNSIIHYTYTVVYVPWYINL